MRKISRTRKNRNKRIKEYLTSILRAFTLLLTNVLELLVYLIKTIVKFVYWLVFKFDSIVAKLFMKLPRPTKAVIIYVLVLTFIVSLQQTLEQKKPIKTIHEIKTAYTEPKVKEEIKEEVKQELTCNYDEVSCKIYNKAKELGMNEEQAKITIAISRWETGNYTSKAFIEKNNVGGMMCKDGLINYNSLDEGIHAFVKNLKNNYFDIGLDTIDKIKTKYCPDNAKNDPNGLNKYWLNGVKEIYNTL